MIEMRTETLAGPTPAMWDAMRNAKTGWAMYREDPSVNELQTMAATVLGKEEALFVPTCQMANLVATMTLASRGTQVVLDADAHIVTSEAWGLAYVVGAFPRLLKSSRGVMRPDAVEEAISTHQRAGSPGTSLVCVENSHTRAGGTITTAEETRAIVAVAHKYGAAVHLDGARVWNVAAALDIPVADLCSAVDTVAVSLNKGLCAPFGAILAGSSKVIELARVNLFRLGGATVQAGPFAAAGILALRDMRARLNDDNQRARDLGDRLRGIGGLRLEPSKVETNIVTIGVADVGCTATEFVRLLTEKGVRTTTRPNERVRFVIHRLIGDREVEAAGEAVESVVEDVRHQTVAVR